MEEEEQEQQKEEEQEDVLTYHLFERWLISKTSREFPFLLIFNSELASILGKFPKHCMDDNCIPPYASKV